METFPLEPDEGFELLPSEEEEDVSPDEALEAAVSSALDDPFDAEIVADPPIPLGRTWKFDRVAGRFHRSGRSPVEVRGEEALQEWLIAAASTARGAHPIFSDSYGRNRPNEPVGRGGMEVNEFLSDLEEELRETWTQHDRVSDVVNLRADFNPSTGEVVLYEVEVVTDEDERIRFGPLALGSVPE